MERSERSRVHFAPETKTQATYTPLAKTKKSSVRKLWLERCRKKEYNELEQDLAQLVRNEGFQITNFFRVEGKTLLDWALVNAPRASEFSFICKHVPHALIQSLLVENDYSLIRSFFHAEIGMEKNLRANPLEQIEKLTLLLTIDAEGIKEFLEDFLQEASDDGPKLRENIQSILLSCPTIKY